MKKPKLEPGQKCEHYCKPKNDAVEFRNDPFLAEIYPEDDNPPSWWCEECLDVRRDEV